MTEHKPCTKLGFHLSTQLSINRSIVQGSGIGPILFIMFIHDLKPLDILNYLLKYADDASLLCPENSSTSIELEMAHVIDWARENKMTVNLLKTVYWSFGGQIFQMICYHYRCQKGWCSQAVRCASHTESFFLTAHRCGCDGM